jgi:hypothetical protein
MFDSWSEDQVLSSHSLRLSWGGSVVYAESMKRTASSSSEVDVTGMNSYITEDNENTDRKMIWKEVESCVADPGELNVEFLAVSADITDLPDSVGCKRSLRVLEKDNDGNATGNVLISYQAILTQVSFDAAVGQYVRGSVTFRLSGYKE